MPEDRYEERERLAREQAASLGAAAALRPFVAALGRHWLLIIALTLLAGGGCIAWFQQKSPDYEAEAQILVSPLPEDSAAFVGLPILRSADDPGRLIETAADIIDSPEAARRAARALPGIDAGAAGEAVDVAADESSNIVSVIAEQSDREEAAALANAYAEGSLEARGAALTPLYRKALGELRAQIAEITASGGVVSEATRRSLAELQVAEASGTDPTMTLTQRAVPPGKPLGLPRWVVIAIAFVGGFAIGALAAVLIDLLTPRRLNDESEIGQILPAPILARIPEAGRGVALAQIIDEIRDSYRNLRGRLTYARPGGSGPNGSSRGLGTVAIISPSRGDGRTTSTINLARAVAGGAQPVVAVDLDLRHPALATISGHTPGSDLGSVLLEGTDPATAIESIGPGLSLLAAPSEAFPAMIERSAGRTPTIIAAARAHADSVVIDTPAFDEAGDALTSVAEADSVVIVIRLGRTTAASLAHLAESLEAAGVEPTGYAVIGAAPSASAASRTFLGDDRSRTRQRA